MKKYNSIKVRNEKSGSGIMEADLKDGMYDFAIYDSDGGYRKTISLSISEKGEVHISTFRFNFNTSNVKKQTLNSATSKKTDCKWFTIGNKEDHVGGTTFMGDHITCHDTDCKEVA